MPIYEYICAECKSQFSLLQSLYPTVKKTECPKCHSSDVKKILSSFSCKSGSDSSSSSMPAPNFGGGGG